MSLRAQLTLWSVLVMAVIVGAVSAVDLAQEVSREFVSTLERADYYMGAAVTLVKQTVDRNPTIPIAEALKKDVDLPNALLAAMTRSNSLLEIAVCDPQDMILVDSQPGRAGIKFPPYDDFQPLVNANLIKKTRVLLSDSQQRYQRSEALGVPKHPPDIYVRVVVYPRLIQKDMIATIRSHAEVSVLLFIGAMVVAFLFSAIAFRPIDKLGHMLDLLTRGEFDNQETLPAPKSPADEFGVVASKVSLLGQQLRGAKYDFSDLRGNFERLLGDLEDTVLVFGRDRRLVVAAGAVEKFLGRDRAELIGSQLVDIFPPSTSLGLLLQQAAQTGRSIRNRRVPIGTGGNGNSSVAVALLSVDVLDALQTGTGAGPGAGIMVRLRDPEEIGR